MQAVPPPSLDELRKKLEGKIEPVAVNILLLRYALEETFESISKELGIFNTETVVRIHDESLKKLRGIW